MKDYSDLPTYEKKKLLRGSADARHYLLYLLILGGGALFGLLLLLGGIAADADTRDTCFVGGGILLAVLLPFGGWYVYSYLITVSDADNFFFTETTLSEMHPAEFFRDGIYFTLHFTDPEGGKIIADTRCVFSSNAVSLNSFDEYLHANALIAYHPGRELAVVIKTL